MQKNIFDKLHVAYRVFIIVALLVAAVLGFLLTSSCAYANPNTTWVPMPWPPDMVPHPHPPSPPPPPPGGPMATGR